jgi:hypothetical protein
MKRAVLSWSIVAALAGAGCNAASITDAAPTASAAATGSLLAGGNLIECPTSVTSTATALVTPLGGIVSVGGTSISVPVGAVLLPTTIQVTVPASNYMEVDISVPGVEHFVFQQPVSVTVSYARCTRADIDKSPLTAWYIDGTTKALLEAMGGVDDKVARTVTFTTPHLSGYALAN